MRAAGATVEGDDAVFGAVPVFGCMDLTTNRMDGTPCVPLFLSMADAQRAVREATAELLMTPGGPGLDETGPMEIDIFSLDKAIEQCVSAEPGAITFRFVGPTASLHRIENELGATLDNGPSPSA